MTTFVSRGLVCAALLIASGLAHAQAEVRFQAHRGAIDEAPENTLAALRHAYGVPGAVPEVDLRTTADGVIVCLHDETPARTTDAPEEWRSKDVAEIPYDVVRTWDAGAWFDAKYAGERIPTLQVVFALTLAAPEREIYLDLKAVALDAVVAAIEAAGLQQRVIFVSGDQKFLPRIAQVYPGARTMTWLSGPPVYVQRQFDRLWEEGMPGIHQLQFHLPVKNAGPPVEFTLSPAFLRAAKEKLDSRGIDLQLRPFSLAPEALRPLLDLGVRWYVADAPAAFAQAIAAAQAAPTSTE